MICRTLWKDICLRRSDLFVQHIDLTRDSSSCSSTMMLRGKVCLQPLAGVGATTHITGRCTILQTGFSIQPQVGCSFHTSTLSRREEKRKEIDSEDTAHSFPSPSVKGQKRNRLITTPSFPPPSFPKSFGANQVVPLDDELQTRLDKILNNFPGPIRFSFAYGSGVFSQSEAGPEHAKKPATKEGKKMVDVVMAVSHPEHWHALNRARNKVHYSMVARLMGSLGVGFIQKLGAGLWYHPYIKLDDEVS